MSDETRPNNSVVEWTNDAIEGRVLIWIVGSQSYGIEQPLKITIAQQATNKLALGFSHSGYSEDDPDGKSALLTLTIATDSQPLSQEEKSALEGKGILFDQSFSFEKPKSWMLDISLPSDKTEEQRIRTALQLPKKISAPGFGIPLQIKWKNVDGAILYKWLTSSDGLHILLTGKTNILWQREHRITVDRKRLEAWWNKNAKGALTLVWKGGEDPLVHSVIGEGCLVEDDGSQSPINIKLLVKEAGILAERIAAVSVKLDDGKQSIDKDKFLEMDWNISEKQLFRTYVDANTSLRPGGVLDVHPELIKDLSGQSDGLKGLLGKP